jgi:hypothetical protein
MFAQPDPPMRWTAIRMPRPDFAATRRWLLQWRESMSRAALLSVVAGLGLAAGAMADPVVLFQSKLGDHPDANESPPAYGLRLDNLFAGAAAGSGGVTTFSFNNPAHGAAMYIQIHDTNDDGFADRIELSGTVYGGDVSSGYATGLYSLNFVFEMGVGTVADGWNASTAHLGGGTLEAMAGNSHLSSGTTFDLFQMTSKGDDSMGPMPFEFRQDGHRLEDFASILARNPHVGRGWLTTNPTGDGVSGTQDFLFVTIPLPGSAGLAMVGLGMVAVRRRRSA